MPSLYEARQRHAKYYAEIAQHSRSDFDRLTLEMANVIVSGNFYLDNQDWQRLPDLLEALNEYWLKCGLWEHYVRFNSVLVKSDVFGRSDRILALMKQLASLEEIRGNYKEARNQYKQILDRYDEENHKDIGLILEVTLNAARLARIQGDDEEALTFLKRALTRARRYRMRKDEVDILLGMAELYRKQEQYERVQSIYDACLSQARDIGYSRRVLDIFVLNADLCFLLRRLERSRELFAVALVTANDLGDQMMAAHIREQLTKIGSAMNKMVFISYSHEDRSFAERLATDLRENGLAVWWAEWEIGVGESIIERVSAGITQSAHLAVVLTPSSVNSDFVRREIGSALMPQLSIEKGITVLPLLLADCEIPVLLREIKFADFRQAYEDGLRELMRVLVGTE